MAFACPLKLSPFLSGGLVWKPNSVMYTPRPRGIRP